MPGGDQKALAEDSASSRHTESLSHRESLSYPLRNPTLRIRKSFSSN